MEGIITIQDKRDNLNQLKNWRAEEAKKINQNLKKEQIIDTIVNVTKKVVEVAGGVATLALAVCPLDGPFGEIATMVATPALVKLVESSRDFLKGIFVNKDKEQIKASICDIAQNVKDISIRDVNLLKTRKSPNYDRMQGVSYDQNMSNGIEQVQGIDTTTKFRM